MTYMAPARSRAGMPPTRTPNSEITRRNATIGSTISAITYRTTDRDWGNPAFVSRRCRRVISRGLLGKYFDRRCSVGSAPWARTLVDPRSPTVSTAGPIARRRRCSTAVRLRNQDVAAPTRTATATKTPSNAIRSGADISDLHIHDSPDGEDSDDLQHQS